MMTITENMVLALLKKGMEYELENCEMDFSVEVPLNTTTMEDPLVDDKSAMVIKGNCKIGKCVFNLSTNE